MMTDRRQEDGFSLLEVLFSLLMLGLITAGLFPAFITHIKFNNDSEIRSGAVAAAQVLLDDLRLADPSTLPSSGSDAAVNIAAGDRTYQVVATYCATASWCPNAETKHIRVQVSYQGDDVYDVDTIYTQLR